VRFSIAGFMPSGNLALRSARFARAAARPICGYLPML
jgi:hypothetical protein